MAKPSVLQTPEIPDNPDHVFVLASDEEHIKLLANMFFKPKTDQLVEFLQRVLWLSSSLCRMHYLNAEKAKIRAPSDGKKSDQLFTETSLKAEYEKLHSETEHLVNEEFKAFEPVILECMTLLTLLQKAYFLEKNKVRNLHKKIEDESSDGNSSSENKRTKDEIIFGRMMMDCCKTAYVDIRSMLSGVSFFFNEDNDTKWADQTEHKVGCHYGPLQRKKRLEKDWDKITFARIVKAVDMLQVTVLMARFVLETIFKMEKNEDRLGRWPKMLASFERICGPIFEKKPIWKVKKMMAANGLQPDDDMAKIDSYFINIKSPRCQFLLHCMTPFNKKMMERPGKPLSPDTLEAVQFVIDFAVAACGKPLTEEGQEWFDKIKFREQQRQAAAVLHDRLLQTYMDKSDAPLLSDMPPTIIKILEEAKNASVAKEATASSAAQQCPEPEPLSVAKKDKKKKNKKKKSKSKKTSKSKDASNNDTTEKAESEADTVAADSNSEKDQDSE